MVKRSEARVTAAVAAAAAPATVSQRELLAEEDNITGEVPPEITSIIFRFAGLIKQEIIHIFLNSFWPINLYWLRHMRRL